VRTHLPLAAVLALFALLVVGHAGALPIFEASDEAAHFIYVHQLATDGALPVIPTRADLDAAAARDDRVAQWAIESHQPPLYYALSAALVGPLTRRADLPAHLTPNDVIFTWGVRAGNPNVWLHPPHPTDGDTVTAVWLARLLSLCFGLVTLWAVYRTADQASGSRSVAFCAALLTASVPMFVLVSGSVTNDSLIIMLSALVTLWSVRVARSGLRRYDGALLGALLGAAALTKITGLALAGVAGLAVLLAVYRRQVTVGRAVSVLALAGALTLLMAGWWYVRNAALYGDPLATAATAELWGRQFGTAGESGGWAELVRIYNSFWLMVGHLHQPLWMPAGFYGYTLALVLMALAGGIRAALRPPAADTGNGAARLVLLVSAALPVGMLWVGTRDVDISYGRLLFPGLAGIATLLTLGWRGGIGRFAPLLVVPLTVSAGALPLLVTAPAYAPLRNVFELPAQAVPVNATAGGWTLAGYTVLDRTTAVGGTVWVEVYFSVDDSARPWVLALALTDGPTRLGGVTRYAGMAAGPMLRADTLYRALLAVPVDQPSATDGPHVLALQAALFDAPEAPALPWTLPDGTTAFVLTLDGPVYLAAGAPHPPPATPLQAVFGEAVQLEGYTWQGDIRAGQTTALRLTWTALAPFGPPPASVTVQVFDSNGAWLTQADSAPYAYPPWAWVAGSRFDTLHALTWPTDLPPDTYHIRVGWYRLDEAFSRLPAQAAPAVEGLLEIAQMVYTQP
jgi:4-amino-4-deoxy-L-arabinose transferase-like glycosyltransferase